MRFIMVIMAALAATLTCQSTALAGIAAGHDTVYADATREEGKKDQSNGSGGDEPDCE